MTSPHLALASPRAHALVEGPSLRMELGVIGATEPTDDGIWSASASGMAIAGMAGVIAGAGEHGSHSGSLQRQPVHVGQVGAVMSEDLTMSALDDEDSDGDDEDQDFVRDMRVIRALSGGGSDNVEGKGAGKGDDDGDAGGGGEDEGNEEPLVKRKKMQLDGDGDEAKAAEGVQCLQSQQGQAELPKPPR